MPGRLTATSSRRTSGTTATSYSYDLENRLIEAADKAYARDAFGRAVLSRVGGIETAYVFDGREVLQEKVGLYPPTHYTRGPGKRIVSKRLGTENPRYYHHDAIGSTTALTDGFGTFTDFYSYEAFGNLRARAGEHPQPFRYPTFRTPFYGS